MNYYTPSVLRLLTSSISSVLVISSALVHNITSVTPVMLVRSLVGIIMLAPSNDSRALDVAEDATIDIKALDALRKQEDLWDKSHITAVSYNKVLLLIGQVPNERSKKLAEDVVKKVPKVHSVYNELTVGNPIGLKQRSKDTWITAKVKEKFVENPRLHATKTKVITENNIVYLMGLTSTSEEKEAIKEAQTVKGVQQVYSLFDEATD